MCQKCYFNSFFLEKWVVSKVITWPLPMLRNYPLTEICFYSRPVNVSNKSSVVQRCSARKAFSMAQVFSCWFYEIFKIIFFLNTSNGCFWIFLSSKFRPWLTFQISGGSSLDNWRQCLISRNHLWMLNQTETFYQRFQHMNIL